MLSENAGSTYFYSNCYYFTLKRCKINKIFVNICCRGAAAEATVRAFLSRAWHGVVRGAADTTRLWLPARRQVHEWFSRPPSQPAAEECGDEGGFTPQRDDQRGGFDPQLQREWFGRPCAEWTLAKDPTQPPQCEY